MVQTTQTDDRVPGPADVDAAATLTQRREIDHGIVCSAACRRS
jgi:hypothetical protein